MNHYGAVIAGLKQVEAPTVEPVTLAQARRWLKWEETDTSEDAVIGPLVTAARQQVEADAGLHLQTQKWDLALHRFPSGWDARAISLLVAPLQAVESVKVYDTANVETTWSSANYYVDIYSRPARLHLNDGVDWPSNLRPHIAAVIRLRTGYVGTALSVTTLTHSGSTATATTSVAHGLVTGDVATVAGASQAEYNGAFEVTVLNATQFTMQVTGMPVSPATGTITATPTGVPAWAAMAIRMRLATLHEHRELFNDEQRLYEWLVGSHRMVWVA